MSSTNRKRGGLTVTRRPGESIVIGDGDNLVVVTVVSSKNGKIRINTQAGSHISVDRLEVRVKRDKTNGKDRSY